jgi:hypothetical protein
MQEHHLSQMYTKQDAGDPVRINDLDLAVKRQKEVEGGKSAI